MPDWLSWPKAILMAAVATGTILVYLTGLFEAPKRLDVVEKQQSEMSVRQDVTLELLSDMVRGECLESCAEKLMLQGLTAKCEALGVARQVGDKIDERLQCDE